MSRGLRVGAGRERVEGDIEDRAEGVKDEAYSYVGTCIRCASVRVILRLYYCGRGACWSVYAKKQRRRFTVLAEGVADAVQQRDAVEQHRAATGVEGAAGGRGSGDDAADADGARAARRGADESAGRNGRLPAGLRARAGRSRHGKASPERAGGDVHPSAYARLPHLVRRGWGWQLSAGGLPGPGRRAHGEHVRQHGVLLESGCQHADDRPLQACACYALGLFATHTLPVSELACTRVAVPTSHKATITNCAITIGTRLMRTAVIDSKDAGQYSGGGGGGGGGGSSAALYPELASCSKFDPACFRMPIPNLRRGELVEMQISYFEALDYVDGQYVVSVPLAFDGVSLAGRSMESLVDIQCTINAGCPNCTLGECTFPYQRQQTANAGVVALSGDKTKPWMSNRFEVKYSVGAQDILTNCLNDSESQCFSMVVAPPPADKVMAQYNKHVIFLIDRSGSMHGTPIANAKAALKEAVTSLNAGDFFNIVQFDHEQIFWAPTGPQPASTENKQNAHFWIDEIRARGTTDIMTPLQASITALENMPVNTDAGMCLPFVFLLTDGAVSNEREICQYLQQSRRRTRVMTLGIGEYCNYYFLQMMALMGHGFCELALQPDKIYQQVKSLSMPRWLSLTASATL